MPRSRTLGRGRPCLAVGTSEAAFRRTVEGLGFEIEGVTGEIDALTALDRKAYAAAFVSQQVGAATLQAVVARAGQRRREIPVVVLGSTAALQDAVDAMQLGAADFLAPPFAASVVEARLRKVIKDVAPPSDGSESGGPALGHLGLVGSSAAMNKLHQAIERISRYKTNVLVLGESGSGKELIARALHGTGPRRKHLFVALNCATLGREILENELFGHERGAFTGANERKKGLFELADGGTLFLDEIGELDPSTQAKLLRVLERNEFRRVGGTAKVKVDLSIIAATNRNLEEAIAANRFREDLYYRLKVVTVAVPPLRERREDIPALIDSFIADFNRRHDGKIKGIAPQALRRLMEHDWPGNVRELKNAVESSAVMATSNTIGPSDLDSVPFGRRASGSQASAARVEPERPSAASGSIIPIPAEATLAEAEQLLITERLSRARTKGDAARSLGIGLRTLYTKISLLGLEAVARLPRGQRRGSQGSGDAGNTR